MRQVCTEQQEFELFPSISLVLLELPIDLLVDDPGLLGGLAQAAQHVEMFLLPSGGPSPSSSGLKSVRELTQMSNASSSQTVPASLSLLQPRSFFSLQITP